MNFYQANFYFSCTSCTSDHYAYFVFISACLSSSSVENVVIRYKRHHVCLSGDDGYSPHRVLAVQRQTHRCNHRGAEQEASKQGIYREVGGGGWALMYNHWRTGGGGLLVKFR